MQKGMSKVVILDKLLVLVASMVDLRITFDNLGYCRKIVILCRFERLPNRSKRIQGRGRDCLGRTGTWIQVPQGPQRRGKGR